MSTQISTGIIVGGGSDNNGTNNSENRGVIERDIPPRWVIATFGIMSVCYTIWFVVELIWVGNQNAWQFYMPGLMMEIGLVLVLLIVLVLSVIGLWPQICCCSGDEMNSARIALYCASIALGLVAAGFYFYLYVPLQSSAVVWFIRWVPWVVISLMACCTAPFCFPRRSYQQPVVEADDIVLDTDLEEGNSQS
jgi:hypothetical protein